MDDWWKILISAAGTGLTMWITNERRNARLESRVERLEEEVGNSDRGLRKRVHDNHNLLTQVEGRVAEIEARRTRR